MADKGYFLEFQQVGPLVRVTAIDPASGKEAVIQGPASAGETALGRAAIQKLEYLLRKNHADGQGQ
jgi:hypothetical protein